MTCLPLKYWADVNKYLVADSNQVGTHFIVIDGPSGSGKTTLAKLLAKSINGQYLHCPPTEFQPVAHEIRRMSEQTQFFFYLSANIAISQQVSAALHNSHVIVDRYIYTTLAWYSALGVSSRIDMGSLELLRPNLAFLLLTSSEEVRRQRVRVGDRNYTKADEMLESHPDVYASYVAQLRSFGLDEVETSTRTIDDILAYMVKQVEMLRTD